MKLGISFELIDFGDRRRRISRSMSPLDMEGVFMRSERNAKEEGSQDRQRSAKASALNCCFVAQLSPYLIWVTFCPRF
jgi:hypothetical protein